MTRMDRRTFALDAASLAGLAALAGAALPLRVRAQGTQPVEGTDYQTLAKPLAIARTGKIEVVEFFWYGCPHCFAFEPALDAWIAKLPADVHFRRVPVGFDALKEIHQRIFYTWEALGVLDTMHLKTFARFHVRGKPVNSLGDVIVLAQENGLDPAKVTSAWDSFAVNAKCTAAKRLADDYDIDQTPEMAIHGRFTAAAQPSAGPNSVLATTDWLVNRIRHGG
jgi:protein dithiol oxidoreductase (disulfide-forming)